MNLIFNTRTFWEEPPRARHQLARALVNEKHIIYFVAKNKSGRKRIEIINVERNIYLIQPYWTVKGVINYRMPIINELYQSWLFKEIKKQIGDHTVINFDPSAWLLFKYFRVVIYFCTDDFLAYKRSKCILVSFYHFLTERRIIVNALFNCGVSKYLVEKLSRLSNASHLFLTAAPMIDTGNNIKKIETNDKEFVKVVYVGWVDKIDYEWLKKISGIRNYRIYIVGPKYKKYKNMLVSSNVIFTGEKKNRELYEFLSKSDVAIAPYFDDEDTKKVYTMPNKFWLYLAFGLPIVTRKISNLADLPPRFVYEATTSDEFVTKIELAFKDNSDELREKRRAFARKNTWEQRGKEFNALLQRYINE